MYIHVYNEFAAAHLDYLKLSLFRYRSICDSGIFSCEFLCGGSFCFMSWCINNFFVLLAPYVCFHIFS